MVWNVMDKCLCLCRSKVVPAKQVKICLMCLEAGAAKRICCNANYCDFCYTKNKLCPNCNAATRQEKQTGAVFMITALSEHEECRSCLDPGLKRRCCDNYYCDECYYNQPLCRVCSAPVGTRNENPLDRARYVPIMIGWGISIFIIIVVIIGVLVIVANEPLIPVGVFGYKCYGFFPSCNLQVCIDVMPAIASGDISLNPLNTFQSCTLNSLAKIETQACVYDSALYTETQGLLGYDICYNSFKKGSYIFEDTFEYWQNATVNSNTMKSGFWGTIMNGRANDFCGTSTGKKALSFEGGTGGRYAETIELDLSSGGWLEGDIFLAPLGYDFTHPNCKTAYAGSVDISYTTNNGRNFTVLATLNPLALRSSGSFFPVKFDFPVDPSLRKTKIRFSQPYFNIIGDGWAIDNIKVFRYFPPNWHTNSGFKDSVSSTYNFIQKAQCCFDTEWCETRLNSNEMEECEIDIPFYNGKRYIIRGAEIFIVIAVCIGFFKFMYVSVQEFLMKRRYPFQDEVEDIAKFDRLLKLIPMRLDANMIIDFADEEGSGEVEKTKDDIKLEVQKEKQRIRRGKEKALRIIQKLRKANKEDEKGQDELRLMAELEESDSDGEEDEEKAIQKDIDTTFGTDGVLTDKDKLKRKDAARLRTPFECRVSKQFRIVAILLCLIPVTITVLIKINITSDFIIHQVVYPYGRFEGDIALTSDFLNLLAFICDIKEVWHTLKYVIAARDEWVPQLTLDTSEEVKALYIGTHTVLLKEIIEFNPFKRRFVIGIVFAHVWGCFPWCLFSLILRDQYLAFEASRIVTPILGMIAVTRAILGPGIFMKIYFCLTYLLGLDFDTRERVGRALQSQKTKIGAVNASIVFCIVGTFLSASVNLSYLAYAFVGSFFGGLIFGAATGCYHSLPIKPWMYITTLDDGVWLRVKRKVKCPCKKSCMYCTNLHEFQEMFIVYPQDSMRFFNVVKSASAAADD